MMSKKHDRRRGSCRRCVCSVAKLEGMILCPEHGLVCDYVGRETSKDGGLARYGRVVELSADKVNTDTIRVICDRYFDGLMFGNRFLVRDHTKTQNIFFRRI